MGFVDGHFGEAVAGDIVEVGKPVEFLAQAGMLGYLGIAESRWFIGVPVTVADEDRDLHAVA